MDTYRATNTTNGKFYIGSTTNFEKRKKAHLCSRENYPFQNALRNNPEAFEWEVWSNDSDEPVLEQALLDMWFGKECCYNLNPSASRPPQTDTTGYLWWNDGQTNKRSPECPGQGWVEGVIREESDKHLAHVRSLGRTPWWTNGFENKRSWVCPGEKWTRGFTKETSPVPTQFTAPWWTNGEENRRSDECPGEGWKQGVTAVKPTSRPVRVTNLSTGEFEDFPSICAAAKHYGLRDSKLGSVARGKYGQHKGYTAEFI